jgi:hypothetical protein
MHRRPHDELSGWKRGPFQFGLRSMLGMVVASGVVFTGFRRLDAASAALLLGVVVLVIVGIRLTHWSSRLVALTWAAALAVLLQLHWSYGWALPLFGVVPGFPDDFVHTWVEAAGMAVVILGGAIALGSLALGTFTQRLISLPPAMLLLILFGSVVASVL